MLLPMVDSANSMTSTGRHAASDVEGLHSSHAKPSSIHGAYVESQPGESAMHTTNTEPVTATVPINGADAYARSTLPRPSCPSTSLSNLRLHLLCIMILKTKTLKFSSF